MVENEFNYFVVCSDNGVVIAGFLDKNDAIDYVAYLYTTGWAQKLDVIDKTGSKFL